MRSANMKTGPLAHVPRMCKIATMAKMIQVRHVPDALHRELVRRARARGETLTDYVQDILEREVSRPPAQEVFDRIARRRPVKLTESAAALLRQERGDREAS